MKCIVELSHTTYYKIKSLVEQGKFHDFQEFINIAIQNQLTLEDSSQKGESDEYNWRQLLKIPNQEVYTEPPQRDNLGNSPLWGQYYRFLPLKVVLRVLANLYPNGPLDHQEAKKRGVEIAILFGEWLRKIDDKINGKRGEKLSVTFPTRSEKSIDRFSRQYIGYTRSSDGKLIGMGVELLFLNIKDGKIALTPYGLSFATLRNPVLDDEIFSNSLNEQESEFLITHIMNYVYDEAEHVKYLLMGLKDGVNTRDRLLIHMADYYKRYEFGSSRNLDLISTMMAGVISRTCELGLIKKEYSGKKVFYFLTPLGEKILNISQIFVKSKAETQELLKSHTNGIQSRSTITERDEL